MAEGDSMHGIDLVDQVIDKVKAEGFGALGACGVRPPKEPVPVPEAELARLRFPSGDDLSPALRRWLAFDGQWLGWFDDPTRPVFRPEKLGAFTRREYRFDWGFGELEGRGFGGDCYALHFGSDSRRLLYVGEPDSSGEHPILLTEEDDDPWIGVQKPGIDVYLGIHSGVLEIRTSCYGDLAKHAVYGKRMKEHIKRLFGKKNGLSLMQEGIFGAGDIEDAPRSPFPGPQDIWGQVEEKAAGKKAAGKKAAGKKAAGKKAAGKKAAGKKAAGKKAAGKKAAGKKAAGKSAGRR
jgi:hypothetical protein